MKYNLNSICKAKAGAYLPASFLDWDGHVAAVIFLSGCNFLCPWCHNKELVTGGCDNIPVEDTARDIKRRADFLDGVVITGGEPTLAPELIPLLEYFRDINMPVKLDTNGSNPEIIENILKEHLIAHIAMDIKAPLNDKDYLRLTGKAVDTDKIKKSVSIIKRCAKSYEFRTTYVPHLLSIDDLTDIRNALSDDAHWRLQLFKPNNCINDAYRNFPAASADELRKAFPEIHVRG